MTRPDDDTQHDVPPPVPPEAFTRARDTPPAEPHREDLDERATEIVEGGIGLARLALGSAWRTSRWGL